MVNLSLICMRNFGQLRPPLLMTTGHHLQQLPPAKPLATIISDFLQPPYLVIVAGQPPATAFDL